MADERTDFGFKRIVCACTACVRNCYFLPGYLIPADLERIAYYLNEAGIVRFALDNFLASPGAIVVADGECFAIPTIVPARRPDGACRFLCDLRLKMVSGGSKRWRALHGESTIYEMLPEPGWKFQMAASGKWKLDMAESRKILHRTVKSSSPAPNPTQSTHFLSFNHSGAHPLLL